MRVIQMIGRVIISKELLFYASKIIPSAVFSFWQTS